MLTHSEINARFAALDSNPVLLSETFDGWLAWPIVKERLWLACLNQNADSAVRGPGMADSLGRLLRGLWQIGASLVRPTHADQALLYEWRRVLLPSGEAVHPHLGSYPDTGDSLLHVIYGPDRSPHSDNVIHDHDVGAVAAVLAKVLRRLPSLHDTSVRLEEALQPYCPELSAAKLRQIIGDQLARFLIRKAYGRFMLRRAGVRTVVVLDHDSKVSEIAAALSLGIEVVEVQHGMFSRQEPDYSWLAKHRHLPVPLPRRVFVFGSFWRDELLAAGYWGVGDVVQLRSPVLAQYRAAMPAPEPAGKCGPLRVLFASQDYVRETSLSFWREALTLQSESMEALFQLDIKIHPLDRPSRDEYAELARQFPRTCTLVPDDVDAFRALSSCDVVVSYTSLMLVEAYALGLPVFALRGGSAKEGFCAIFNFPDDLRDFVEVDSPIALVAALRALKQSPIGRCGRAVPEDYVFDASAPPVEQALAGL